MDRIQRQRVYRLFIQFFLWMPQVLPCSWKAINGRKCDIEAQQTEQRNEPAGVEDIEQAQSFKDLPGLRCVELFDLPWLCHRGLYDECS